MKITQNSQPPKKYDKELREARYEFFTTTLENMHNKLNWNIKGLSLDRENRNNLRLTDDIDLKAKSHKGF